MTSRVAGTGAVLLVLGILVGAGCPPGPPASEFGGAGATTHVSGASTNPSVSNFTTAIGRIVTLLGLSGSGLLAIVWTRVALSWFSNDVTKKIQAKERARDALIGTILFTAAVSGLLYGLAHWVVTGT
jgi:hypothetical protein